MIFSDQLISRRKLYSEQFRISFVVNSFKVGRTGSDMAFQVFQKEYRRQYLAVFLGNLHEKTQKIKCRFGIKLHTFSKIIAKKQNFFICIIFFKFGRRDFFLLKAKIFYSLKCKFAACEMKCIL